MPDPRWFALLDIVAAMMPQYPIDDAFVSGIPEDLQPVWREWSDRRKA